VVKSQKEKKQFMIQNGKTKAEIEADRLAKERDETKERVKKRMANYRIEFHFLPPSLSIRECATVTRTTEQTFRKRFASMGFEIEKASVNGYFIPKERLFRFMAMLTEENDWRDRRDQCKSEREA
jgi:phenylalanyl-tRNA synthetase alpha subunit